MAKALVIVDRGVVLPPPDVMDPGACCHEEGVSPLCSDLTQADCAQIVGSTWHPGTDCANYDCDPGGGGPGCPDPCQPTCPPSLTVNISGTFLYSAGGVTCGVSAGISVSSSGSTCDYGAGPFMPQGGCQPFGNTTVGIIAANVGCFEVQGVAHYGGQYTFGAFDPDDVGGGGDGICAAHSFFFSTAVAGGGGPAECGQNGGYAYNGHVGPVVGCGSGDSPTGFWTINFNNPPTVSVS